MNGKKSLLAVLMTIAALCVTTHVGLAQPALTVRIDTLFAEGKEAVFDSYSFRLYNNRWCISISNPDPTVLYEDDLYTVRVEDNYDIIFTEKQPTWYIDSHNGWLQYEYVNRQYYFPGIFRQIVRNGDYYYFVYDKRVDSLHIDKYPGNPLVKNTLPDIWDVNDIVHKSKWCDPKSRYGSGLYRSSCLGCGYGYYNSSKPADTTYCGAFVADNQVYYLLEYDKEIFIAQRQGDNMTKVLDLGRGWSFEYRYKWWNLGPGDNRLLKPFRTADGTAGLLTIDGSDIHIQYVMSPATVMP